MTKCKTQSGPYQCERGAGHSGECEAQAPEYATTLEKRIAVLEEQMRSVQMAMPRGIPR
jgi:hypothetical protein